MDSNKLQETLRSKEFTEIEIEKDASITSASKVSLIEPDLIKTSTEKFEDFLD